ncbi:MAG: hypothetical protein OEM83_01825, partial [Gammaproteobacteria bacterium]|nr:hypothetical protein [Gammaproteobacteria bacterium]
VYRSLSLLAAITRSWSCAGITPRADDGIQEFVSVFAGIPPPAPPFFAAPHQVKYAREIAQSKNLAACFFVYCQ